MDEYLIQYFFHRPLRSRRREHRGGFSFDLSGDNHKSKTPSLRLKRKIQLLLICIAIPNKMV
jgi:hypothetical protein